MNWLITGGCGFIGTSLIKAITGTDEGHRIRVLDNLSVGGESDLARVCEFERVEMDKKSNESFEYSESTQLIVGDILDQDLALKVAENSDVIIHLAGNTGVGPSVEDPRSDCMNNVLGILNYLEAARLNNISKFIFASSGAPVGEVEPPIHEEMVPHPVSPYGASKLAGEAYCSAYFQSFGIGTVALRFGNVYGPRSGHKNSVVAKFIKLALDGEVLEVYGDGNQTRDFIYIDDLIMSIIKAALSDKSGGEIFQIATNHETTVKEMLDLLLVKLEEKNIHHIEVKYTEKRNGDVLRNYSDTSKAEKILGWRASMSLENGIAKTIDSFLSR